MTELAASDVMFYRGGRTIIERVNFRAQSGEFVAVIGANGAGKSTVLSALAGLANSTPGFPDRCPPGDPPVQSRAALAEAGGAFIAAVAVFGALISASFPAGMRQALLISAALLAASTAAAFAVFRAPQRPAGSVTKSGRPARRRRRAGRGSPGLAG